LRVAFAGTPPFAVTALEAIVAAGHRVALVLTQPDRPAGRGMRLTPSAVAQAAERLGLTTFKPPALRDAASQGVLLDATADVIVVAAYGLMLPPAVLAMPRRGCINIHASLLPRWRGAAPIQRAILAGDRETGISIMRMEAGLDTGPVLLAKQLAITQDDTTGTVTEALARLGADLITRALEAIDTLQPQPQDPALATYAPKVAKAEASIDWRDAALDIHRRIRAFNPAPGAETRFGADVVKIWEAALVPASGAPGEVIVSDGRQLVVACGSGALQLQRVQRAGGKPVSATEFARGIRIPRGAFFGVAPVGRLTS
jgi:methionyl-tRNA formyltransferase